MQTAKAGMQGYAPTLLIQKTERAKYEEIWNEPEYRAVAPGEHYVETFMTVAQPSVGDDVIDFGCGTGRAGVLLNSRKLNVTLMDFASNCLDEWVLRLCEKYPDSLRFVRHDLSVWPYPVRRAKYGFCSDLMEHIPPKQVETVLWNIVRSARSVFFVISTQPDAGLAGEPLHLTVEPLEWWKGKLEAMRCNVLWSHEADGTAALYVTAFASSADLYSAMVLNVEEDKIQQQIVANLKLGLQEVSPHELQPDAEVVLLAGGPSLNDYAEEIYAKAKAGIPVVTVNGTYNWALAHRIRPAATVILDGREFNRRFVDPVIPGCKYLLSSQCHPDLVASIPKEQVWLWHSGAAARVREAIDQWAQETGQHREWWPVYGGSTVMLRAIMLLRMLGWSKLHIYGFDSCLRDDEHHAYAQPENDGVQVVELIVGGRTFQCAPWMWSQAHEFIGIVQVLANEIQLEVYGDGLIAHILKTAAELPIPPGAEPKQFFIIDEKESSNGNVSIPAIQRS